MHLNQFWNKGYLLTGNLYSIRAEVDKLREETQDFVTYCWEFGFYLSEMDPLGGFGQRRTHSDSHCKWVPLIAGLKKMIQEQGFPPSKYYCEIPVRGLALWRLFKKYIAYYLFNTYSVLETLNTLCCLQKNQAMLVELFVFYGSNTVICQPAK